MFDRIMQGLFNRTEAPNKGIEEFDNKISNVNLKDDQLTMMIMAVIMGRERFKKFSHW